jgi:hypothetical protein
MHPTNTITGPAPDTPGSPITGFDAATLDTIVRQNQRMLSVKELAFHLNHHTNYVYLMRKAGFKMPGGRTTLDAALKWLAENPNWRRLL